MSSSFNNSSEVLWTQWIYYLSLLILLFKSLDIVFLAEKGSQNICIFSEVTWFSMHVIDFSYALSLMFFVTVDIPLTSGSVFISVKWGFTSFRKYFVISMWPVHCKKVTCLPLCHKWRRQIRKTNPLTQTFTLWKICLLVAYKLLVFLFFSSLTGC